jgi:ubiquinol-cytochrome c reductase cytochrome c subunit
MRGGRRAHALALAAPVLAVAVFTPWITTAQPDPGGGDGADEPTAEEAELLARGRELYITGCSSCHGPDGGGEDAPDGSARGPSLESAGEATAYYYLATGRMPLANSEEQPIRKEPAYDEDEIDALVAYVAALGDGEGPRLPDLDLEGADLAQGGEIFRGNCQACHSASGSGGALSYGDAAPRLAPAEPLEVGAAVRAGPGEMPVFGPETISDNQLNDLVRYVDYLDDPDDPGGVPIGRTGPIPEGFVAWLVGMVTLLVLVGWIGTRDPIRRRLRR